MKKMKDDTRICCFSKNCDNLLMWSHYANKHTGMCLEFDITKDTMETTKSLFQVRYTNVNQSVNYIRNAEEYLFRLLVTKSLDWAYEQEFRAVKTEPGIKNEVPFDIAMLKSVIFGCRTTKKDILSIKNILPKGITLKECVLNEYSFKIDIITL